MKLILSTLALGTAAAAPMLQETGADAPQGRPLELQFAEKEGQEPPTSELARVEWNLQLATTGIPPQEQDGSKGAHKDDKKEMEELERSAEELEAELLRLRAELKKIADRPKVSRGGADALNDLEKARRRAVEASNNAAEEARASAQVAREQVSRLREMVRAGEKIEAGTVIPGTTVRELVQEARRVATVEGPKKDGHEDLATAPRFPSKGAGVTRLGISSLTDVTEEEPARLQSEGLKAPAPGGLRGGHGSTFNIRVESGDVHIHAGGSVTHTGGRSAQAETTKRGRGGFDIFSRSSGAETREGAKTDARDIFGRARGGDEKGEKKGGETGDDTFFGRGSRKIIFASPGSDARVIELPEGIDIDFDFDFDEIDLEDITEELEELEALGKQFVFKPFGEGEGAVRFEKLEKPEGGNELAPRTFTFGAGGEDSTVKKLQIMGIDSEELRAMAEGVDEDAESVQVMQTTENGVTKVRVFVNGEEVSRDGGAEDEDSAEEETEDAPKGDERFVWQGMGLDVNDQPAPPSLPAPPASSKGFHLAANPLPSTPASPAAPVASGARAAADAELADLAREIREELRAMREEIRELRAEVMRAPRAPAEPPTPARGPRRGRWNR